MNWFKELNVSFGWRKNAGLITIWHDRSQWSIHFVVSPEYWVFGYREDWYDGPLKYYGLGPLVLLSRAEMF